MKRLVLMRHAKSSWDDPTLDDHARPLNGRGVKSAMALGNWLRGQRVVIDEALISSSTRTRETFRLLEIECDQRVLDTLYHADPGTMLKLLNAATGHTVLMIGHNPGIAWFAHELMRVPPAHDRFDDYPTGATLVARFDIDDWSTLAPGTGTLEAFVIPRELTG